MQGLYSPYTAAICELEECADFIDHVTNHFVENQCCKQLLKEINEVLIRHKISELRENEKLEIK